MILTTFLSLISVINPLGTVPIFLGLTSGQNTKEIKLTAIKASMISVIILFFAYFLGTYILDFFSISIMSLKLAGGIIIMLSGFALLGGKFTKHKGIDKRVKNDAFTKEDPSFTPLAIPMLAGPGSMSFLISLKTSNHGFVEDLQAGMVILIAGVTVFLILASSRFINQKLGASGLTPLSRVIGFIVIAIGIEYIASGIGLYIQSLHVML